MRGQLRDQQKGHKDNQKYSYLKQELSKHDF